MNPDGELYYVEQCGKFFAEYRRMLDSQGEEHLGVTLRRFDDNVGERKFHIEMDALERFALRDLPHIEMDALDRIASPEGLYAKPLDESKPDSIERFKEYTAFFHAWTSENGRKISAVHLTYAKKQGGEQLDQEMWISQRALKTFSACGIEYEKELGLTKRWYTLVRMVGIGHPNGIGVVRTLDSVEDKGGEKERVQRQADQSKEDVLWSHPFRKRLEAGDEFTVDGYSEGRIGNGKIGRGIIKFYLLDMAEKRKLYLQNHPQADLTRRFRRTQ